MEPDKQLYPFNDVITQQATKIAKLQEELEVKNEAIFNMHRERIRRDSRDNVFTWQQVAYHLLDRINLILEPASTMKEILETINFKKIPLCFEREFDKSINYLVDEGVWLKDRDGNMMLNPEVEQ